MKTILAMTLAVLVLLTPALAAQTAAESVLVDSVEEEKVDNDGDADAKQLDDLLTKLALDSMPVRHVEDKDWGKQSDRWDGVKIRFQNGKLRTKRRHKKVNHGTWERYEVSLVDPENSFSIKLDDFQELAKDKVSFAVAITADVNIKARQSKWIKGVQLYSLSANGFASVELTLSVSLGSKMDLAKFPPDIIFDPQVTSADIELSEFRIDRVSKAGGEFAQQITKVVRKKMDQEIASKEEKLVEKLNKKLEENKDHFTLSVHDAVKSKWAGAAEKLLDTDDEDEE